MHFASALLVLEGVGRMGSEPPNLQRNPNEQGVPPAHRKVRRESQEAHRHRVKGPGYGQKPLAVDIMQPRVHSRAPQSHFVRVGVPTRALRPEVWLAFCELVFATRAERADPGSTTRRATVHSLRSGLKIESPKAREGPCVIIFRPWLENHRGSVATAIVQLLQQANQGTKPVPQLALKETGDPRQVPAFCGSSHSS